MTSIDKPLADLHAHLGASVPAHILWEIAHDQGLRLPIKDFHKFKERIDASDPMEHEEYLSKFELTQLIQSSPYAMEKSVFHAIGYAYRKSNITTLEIRFNPILRNMDLYDLDMIILHAIMGMKKACVVYPVRAGLIIETDRSFSEEKSIIAAEKAVKFKDEGVVGFDLSGGGEESIEKFYKAFGIASKGGLKTTVHTGEVTGPEEMWEVIENINPHRIGHGVRCLEDAALMEEIKKRRIILELCPTSNLITGVLDKDAMGETIRTLLDEEIKFCINSDGPEFLKTGVRDEFAQLLHEGVITEEEADELIMAGHYYSFIDQ